MQLKMKFFRYDANYEKQRNSYAKKDGVRALCLYLIYIALVFLHGYLYLTDIDSKILDLSQSGFAIIDVVICFIFIKATKSTLHSIGISRENLKKSLIYGLIGGVILRIFIVIFDGMVKGIFPSIQRTSLMVIVTFIICAASEEIVFRGFIQTRLQGLIKNDLAASLLNAILFLSIHYPVRWVIVGGLDFNVLTGFYIICLVLLHFMCDWVYKKTNCLWGGILLHII